MHVKRAITVRRDREELYALWRDFASFPRFMAHVEDVQVTGERTSHWKARGPLGVNFEWDAEITEDVPSERIAWRSTPGAQIKSSGSVAFSRAPADQGIKINVEMRYDVPGGAASGLTAKLFGEEPQIQIKDDLRRFKQIAETGEVVRSEGTPEGQLGRRMPKQRPAQPLEESELSAVMSGGTS